MSGVTAGHRYTRAERLEQIQRLRDAGMKRRQIAAELGLSDSAVRGIINDPDRSKQLARRERYRGTCKVCGKKTDGSNGPLRAPDLCLQHSNDAVNPRVWTRDAIIDAILRFAAENGRPPAANEWITADPVRRYPPRVSVYGPRRAFEKWADAIEVAGFPRPRVGRPKASA